MSIKSTDSKKKKKISVARASLTKYRKLNWTVREQQPRAHPLYYRILSLASTFWLYLMTFTLTLRSACRVISYDCKNLQRTTFISGRRAGTKERIPLIKSDEHGVAEIHSDHSSHS